jgi:hypothetical protein
MLSSVENEPYKNLVGLAIEQALLEVGGNRMFYDILNIIYENYHSYIPDCCVHPEYLLRAINEQDRKYHDTIIESIMSKLDEFKDRKQVATFLGVLEKVYQVR